MSFDQIEPPEFDPQKFNHLLSCHQQSIGEQEKMIRELAKIYRFAYQALAAEGFDESQIMNIIMAHGPYLGGGLGFF